MSNSTREFTLTTDPVISERNGGRAQLKCFPRRPTGSSAKKIAQYLTVADMATAMKVKSSFKYAVDQKKMSEFKAFFSTDIEISSKKGVLINDVNFVAFNIDASAHWKALLPPAAKRSKMAGGEARYEEEEEEEEENDEWEDDDDDDEEGEEENDEGEEEEEENNMLASGGESLRRNKRKFVELVVGKRNKLVREITAILLLSGKDQVKKMQSLLKNVNKTIRGQLRVAKKANVALKTRVKLLVEDCDKKDAIIKNRIITSAPSIGEMMGEISRHCGDPDKMLEELQKCVASMTKDGAKKVSHMSRWSNHSLDRY
jgi:hypothetical protein